MTENWITERPRSGSGAVTHLAKNIVPALALSAALIAAPAAFAHSLEDLESMLGDKEKYFQPVEKEAPGFALRNADGESVRLADLRGQVVVLHFIYASCPDVCPLHAEKIAEIQEMVNRTAMKDAVQFVSITTDPRSDVAEVLRAYGPAHGLDPSNWTFLTTTPGQPEDATRRLAKAYGHRFSRAEDGYQTHGIVTHVIDREGRWRANFHGLEFNPVNLVLFVNALVNDVHRPDEHGRTSWWDRVRALF
ncbi:MAG: SCO family protein [Kiloniellales bacterium]